MLHARSTIFTGSPMSSTKIWPRPPIAPACTTRDTASGIVMKKRVMSGCVIVTGPPFAICLRNVGMTLPDEFSTLPKRTPTKRVDTSRRWPSDSTIHSQIAFDWPITVCGLTALSVEIRTNRSTSNSAASSATTFVATTLLRTDASGCVFISGTCLYAAAWKTIVGPYFSNTSRRIAFASFTSTSLGTAAVKSRSSTSSRSISKSGVSALSTRIRRDGPTRAICLQSSAPIDPPAPVMSTVCPLRYDATLSKSTSTCSRPSTSSTCTGLICPARFEVAGDQLVEARQRLHGDVRRLSRLDDEPARLAGRGRDRDQHLVRLELADEPRQVGHRAEHPHAVDARVPLARIVVDEADRRVREHPRAVHLLDDQPAGIPRSDDDHLFAARDDTEAEARPLDERARREPHPGDEREGDEQVHHGDRARQPDAVHRRDEVHGHVGEERRDDDAARRAPHVAHRHVPPPAAMEAEHEEDRELDRDDEQDRAAKQRVVVDRQALVEPELEREHPGDGDDRRVRQQLQQPVAADSGHAAAAPAPTRSGRRRRRAPAPRRACRARAAPRSSPRDRARSRAASLPRSRGIAARAAGAAAWCSTWPSRFRPRSAPRGCDRAPASGRRRGGRCGPARPRGARRARRARALRNAPLPRGARDSSRRAARGRSAACRPGARRGASCSRRSRSRSCRASRGTRASAHARRASSSLVATSPPSPRQKRFFVGKKL